MRLLDREFSVVKPTTLIYVTANKGQVHNGGNLRQLGLSEQSCCYQMDVIGNRVRILSASLSLSGIYYLFSIKTGVLNW